jgi:hypothetical protein
MTAETLLRGVRPSDALALVLVLASFAIGVLASDAVPAEMVVHYTPPGGVYYGPETLPRRFGLFVVPGVTAVTFAVIRALPLVVDLDGTATSLGRLYRFGTLLFVAVLVGVQATLVLLNVL